MAGVRKQHGRPALVASGEVCALGSSAARFAADLAVGAPVPKAALDRRCFVAATMILMADGGVAPIERVVVGATVIGRHGRANRVIGVQRAVLGQRSLYALNGGRCFVTAEHPFMTPVGWKAIDRASARTEGSDLKVGRLVPGDAIALRRATDSPAVSGQLALAAASEAELVFEPVTRLRSCRADPATPLYNLLLDGDHSYFADDYLVHDNVAGGHGNTLTAVRAESPGNRERQSHPRLRKPGTS